MDGKLITLGFGLSSVNTLRLAKLLVMDSIGTGFVCCKKETSNLNATLSIKQKSVFDFLNYFKNILNI